MAEVQSITNQVSCVHKSNEEPFESKSTVAVMTTSCELANDECVGSLPVEVSQNIGSDAKNEENEAVLQDVIYTSVIAGTICMVR